MPPDPENYSPHIEPRILEGIEKILPVLYTPYDKDKYKKERDYWGNIVTQITDFTSGLDLTDQVHQAVGAWVQSKIPQLQEKVPGLKNLQPQSVATALVEGLFSEIKDASNQPLDISGKKREVLLTVAAHVVRHIETQIYIEILKACSDENLIKLGLNVVTRDLTCQLLEVSQKADPLFIRFLAFSDLSKKPSVQASADGFTLPDKDQPYTLHQLFPHETQYLSRHHKNISGKSGDWEKLPGGSSFKQYLELTSQYYAATNPVLATEIRNKANTTYKKSIQEGFPIVLTGPSDETIKPPYIDPELKVSIRTPETFALEKSWSALQAQFTTALSIIECEGQASSVRDQLLVASIVLGDYGINLTFNAVAQENPTIGIYLDTQARMYDRPFKFQFLFKYLYDAQKTFDNSPQTEELIASIPAIITILHELTHWVFPEGSVQAEKFGNGATNRTVQEVKAECLYRALIPELIKSGALQGTKEQWAMALTASSIQFIKENISDPTDDYYLGAVYSFTNWINSQHTILCGQP